MRSSWHRPMWLPCKHRGKRLPQRESRSFLSTRRSMTHHLRYRKFPATTPAAVWRRSKPSRRLTRMVERFLSSPPIRACLPPMLGRQVSSQQWKKIGLSPSSVSSTATGVQQAGMGGKLTIVGFDAGPAQVEQLKKGTVQALVAQEPAAIGKAGVTQALAALNKQQVTAKIQTGFTIITKDNVDGDAKSAIYRSSCG